MKINSNTKISELINANNNAIEAIASLNSNFNKLRNPLLRRILAPRVNIGEAAKIGKINISELFNTLKQIGFEIEEAATFNTNDDKNVSNYTGKWDINFDARELIDNGEDPFNLIIKELKKLPIGKILRLITPFEPLPLIRILEKRGYQHGIKQEGKTYYTFFWKLNTLTDHTINFLDLNDDERHYQLIKNKFINNLIKIDVSTMEMPQPMLTVMAELEKLRENCALEIFHRRIPHLMLPELEAKGYHWLINQETENKVYILVYKN